MRPLRSVLLLFAACSPIAVTPPARTLALDSPSSPARGTDMQVDTARVGQLFGPELSVGGLRLRHSLQPGIVGEVDGNVLHVNNAGDGPNRTAYTGRLGMLLTSPGQHAAVGVGLGGGTSPAAGSWTSVDAGVLLGLRNRYVRPVLGGWVGYSAPLDHRTFTVSDENTQTTLQLPHNVFAQANLGLELGPPECAVVIGMSVLEFWLREDSVVHDHAARTTGSPSNDAGDLTQEFVAVGFGLRLSW
jgi:hypothetical protein